MDVKIWDVLNRMEEDLAVADYKELINFSHITNLIITFE